MGVEDLRQRLGRHKLVFLDTMIFVYLLEQNPTYIALAETIFAEVEAGTLEALTSVLTLAEVLTGPAQAQDVEAMHDYELYLTSFPHLKIVGVERQHVSAIAQVRAATGLRTPDAIQIAVATVAGADAIIGNDKAWNGKTGETAYLMLNAFR